MANCERIVTDAKGNTARINLAYAGCYAVAIGAGIYKAASVAELREKVAALGWK